MVRNSPTLSPPPAKADCVSASRKTRPFAPTVRADLMHCCTHFVVSNHVRKHSPKYILYPTGFWTIAQDHDLSYCTSLWPWLESLLRSYSPDQVRRHIALEQIHSQPVRSLYTSQSLTGPTWQGFIVLNLGTPLWGIVSMVLR